jgi:hypothetical protein
MSMSASPISKRLLDPAERASEVLFGLIMVLTVTGSLPVAQGGRTDVHTLLMATLGCNLAWGVIDAAMYLMGCFSQRGQDILMVRMVRHIEDPQAARRIIAGTLPPLLASHLPDTDLEVIRQRLKQLPEPPAHAGFKKKDWLGALGVFLLVFVSTLPVVVPFTVIKEARLALRISNGVAIAMLFLAGHRLGRYTGYQPWKMGLFLVLIGITMVGIAIGLGG